MRVILFFAAALFAFVAMIAALEWLVIGHI